MTTAPKRQPIPFGKYLLLDRVNIGGMAEVWRGKTFGAGGFERVVAIKRILPNIAEDEEFISMFIDEAKITVQLNHANVAQIYELAQVSSSYFIAMEYISGKDMRAVFDRCRKKGEPAPIPLTCYAIAKCCEGLDYAHRQKDRQGRDMGIVHRDVSPQNALISFDGEVKVIDFGIAKAAGKATKTQAGILKGKFGYMSPEQIRGLPLDRRSDVFAIGVCLYEMLTGERLFVGDSDFSVLEKVRKVEMLPPTTYNRKIPEALEKIVLKALAKDVDDRYQYASELGDDLQRFLITSDSIFSRKDLSQYMKATFAEEYEREKQRMMEYAEIRAPEGMLAAAEQNFGVGVVPPAGPGGAGQSGITNMPISSPPSMAGPGALQNSGVGRPPTSRPSVPPPQLTPQGLPSFSPPSPTRSPSLPRLSAVAPMLGNGKQEHQSTMLVDGQEMFGGEGAGGSTDENPSGGNDDTLYSYKPPKNGGGVQDTDEQVGMMTLPPRAAPLGKPLPLNFGAPAATPPNGIGELQTEMRGTRIPGGRQALIPTVPGGQNAGEITEPGAAPSGKGKTIALVAGFLVLLTVLVGGIFVLKGGPKGLLYVEIPADAAGAVQVNINGKEILEDNQTPLKPGPHLIPVPAGPVVVMMNVAGYENVLETVQVKEGNGEYTRMLNKLQKKKPSP